ncbi:hypothetical protein J6590_103899, partial [Homalodisca vitripennis]
PGAETGPNNGYHSCENKEVDSAISGGRGVNWVTHVFGLDYCKCPKTCTRVAPAGLPRAAP